MFEKIASNTISQILSKAATALISIFLISILTNFLSVEMYGLYSKIYNYIGIFVFLADLGLYTITIREITNNKSDSAKIVGNITTLRFLLGIVMIFLAVFIALFMPGYDSSLALISIVIVSVFNIFQLFNSSSLALMQANMKIEFSLFSIVFGKLLNLAGVAIVAFLLYSGLNSNSPDELFFTPFILIMLSGLFGIIVTSILNYLYATRKIVNFGFDFDKQYIKKIFKISVPYGIALFLSVVYFKIDVIILSLIEGPEKGDLSIALYSLPMKIVEVLMVIGGFYLNSILPSLTRFFESKDNKSLQNLLQVSYKLLLLFSSSVFVCGVLFRENIIKIIANNNYLDAAHQFNSADAFLVVYLVIIFYFISLIFIYILIASKNQSKLLSINIIVTIFNIIGNLILIPKYSFIGAGIITVFSQILLMLLAYIYTQKIIRFKIPKLFTLKIIVIGVLIYFLGIFITSNISFGLYFDTLVYGGVLFILYLLCFYRDIKAIKN